MRRKAEWRIGNEESSMLYQGIYIVFNRDPLTHFQPVSIISFIVNEIHSQNGMIFLESNFYNLYEDN